VINCTVGGEGSGLGGCCVEGCWVGEIGFKEGGVGNGFNGGRVAGKTNDSVIRVGCEILEESKLSKLLIVVYRGQE
jgi:hypothetical protein